MNMSYFIPKKRNYILRQDIFKYVLKRHNNNNNNNISINFLFTKYNFFCLIIG